MKHLGFAPGVYGQVVPGGYGARVLNLAWIIASADISVGSGKYHQGLGAVGQFLPLAVGTGKVSIERAIAALATIQQQRQVTGLQTLFAVGDQHGQAGLFNLLLQLGKIGFLVARRCEHEDCPWRMAQS
ncbi:hypothetical protein D3C78_1596980 [compost metagenome]